jgi:ABC-type Fe3+/spermidine/putrescine transport system ATPase subunit
MALSSSVGTFKIKKNGQPLPRQVSIILRPEKVRLLRSKSTTQENLMEGEIQDQTYLGSRTEYAVKIGNSTFKVFEQELERLKKRRLNTGDRVFLAWRSDDAIVLPQSV